MHIYKIVGTDYEFKHRTFYEIAIDKSISNDDLIERLPDIVFYTACNDAYPYSNAALAETYGKEQPSQFMKKMEELSKALKFRGIDLTTDQIISVQNLKEQSALTIAIKKTLSGKSEIPALKTLLAAGANINISVSLPQAETSLLSFVAAYGNLEITRELLKREDLDLNKRGDPSWTLALINNHADLATEIIVKIFERGGADGLSAIDVIAQSGFTTSVNIRDDRINDTTAPLIAKNIMVLSESEHPMARCVFDFLTANSHPKVKEILVKNRDEVGIPFSEYEGEVATRKLCNLPRELEIKRMEAEIQRRRNHLSRYIDREMARLDALQEETLSDDDLSDDEVERPEEVRESEVWAPIDMNSGPKTYKHKERAGKGRDEFHKKLVKDLSRSLSPADPIKIDLNDIEFNLRNDIEFNLRIAKIGKDILDTVTRDDDESFIALLYKRSKNEGDIDEKDLSILLYLALSGKGRIHVARALIYNDGLAANIESFPFKKSTTPLRMAIKYGNYSAVEDLIEGAQKREMDVKRYLDEDHLGGYNALQMAVLLCDPEPNDECVIFDDSGIVRLLLSSGANISVLDKHGRNILELAFTVNKLEESEKVYTITEIFNHLYTIDDDEWVKEFVRKANPNLVDNQEFAGEIKRWCDIIFDTSQEAEDAINAIRVLQNINPEIKDKIQEIVDELEGEMNEVSSEAPSSLVSTRSSSPVAGYGSDLERS